MLLETKEGFEEGCCWTTAVTSRSNIFLKTKTVLIDINTFMKANLITIN